MFEVGLFAKVVRSEEHPERIGLVGEIIEWDEDTFATYCLLEFEGDATWAQNLDWFTDDELELADDGA